MATRVSAADRAAVARQARVAAQHEVDDEPEGVAAGAARAELDTWRAAHGIPPLAEWWQHKPELELQERARALGLLD